MIERGGKFEHNMIIFYQKSKKISCQSKCYGIINNVLLFCYLYELFDIFLLLSYSPMYIENTVILGSANTALKKLGSQKPKTYCFLSSLLIIVLQTWIFSWDL